MTAWTYADIPGSRRLRRALRRWRHALGPQIVVLMYHRVASVPCDPWDQCVTPEHFDAQLDILKRTVDVIPLADVRNTATLQYPAARAVAITFDDGYADNLHAAHSILERHHLPATFFLTSGLLGRRREFWWDELERLFLYPGKLPESLDLTVSGRKWSWALGKDAIYSPETWERHRDWRAWDPPETERQRLYLYAWNGLRNLSGKEQDRVLSELFVWAGLSQDPRDSHRILTHTEVRRLASQPDVELGAHTVHHAALSSLSRTQQLAEIRTSKIDVERLTGRRVRYFAYPYGDYSDDTTEIVRDAGFTAAVTTREGSVGLRSSLWQWPRCKVFDWDGESFSNRLQWMLNGNEPAKR